MAKTLRKTVFIFPQSGTTVGYVLSLLFSMASFILLCLIYYLIHIMNLTGTMDSTSKDVLTETTKWSKILKEAWGEMEGWERGLILFVIFFIDF